MSITITVPGLPVAQPRQRTRVMQFGGRTVAQNYTPKTAPVNEFKAACRLAANAAYQGAPIGEPIAISLVFIFPRPKAMIWKSRPMPRVHKASKPDFDNVAKSVADALTGIIWQDDAQLARVTIEKVIAAGDEQPRTEIVVSILN